jgi:hypothetical protein
MLKGKLLLFLIMSCLLPMLSAGYCLSVESPNQETIKRPETTASAQMSDHDILKKADEARGNLAGIEWEVSVVSNEKERNNFITYFVQARAFDIMANTLAPPKYKDNKLLMVNSNMWFYKPGLTKPFPISQRQKLMGNASYGDIAATNYADDYTISSTGTDLLDKTMCYVYDLKAAKKECTYDRIKYWVSKEKLVGIQAEYYTLSGKVFKTAKMEYMNIPDVSKQMIPFISKMNIYDELMSSNVTVLTFDKPVIKQIPNYVFNLNLIMK